MSKLPVGIKFTLIDRVSAGMAKIKNSLDAVGDKMGRVTAKSKEATKAMVSNEKRLQGFSKMALGAGGALTAGLAAPAALAGKSIYNNMKTAQEATLDYAAATNLSGDALEGIRKKILDMTGKGRGSYAELMNAATVAAKAGMADPTEAVGPASAFARLNNMSIEEAMEQAAVQMTLFNKKSGDAEEIFNRIQAAADASVISAQELAKSLEYVGNAAPSVGWDMKQVYDLTAYAGATGLRGEKGGTTIRNMMSSLAGDKNRQKKLEAIPGLDLSKIWTNADRTKLQEPLVILEELGKHMNIIQANSVFGKEFGNSILGMAQKTETFRQIIAKTDKSWEGMMEKMLGIKDAGIANAERRMSENWNKLSIAIGDSGIIQSLTKILNLGADFIGWLAKLPAPVLKWGAIMIGAGAVVVSLTAALGGLGLGLLGFQGAAGAAGLASGGMVKTIMLAGAKFGLWGIAIAGAVAAGWFLVENWGQISRGISAIFDGMDKRLNKWVYNHRAGLQKAADAINLFLPKSMEIGKVGSDHEAHLKKQAEKNQPGWFGFEGKDAFMSKEEKKKLEITIKGANAENATVTKEEGGKKTKVPLPTGKTSNTGGVRTDLRYAH